MNPSPPRSLTEVVAGLIADSEPYLSCDECFDRICAYVEQTLADPGYVDAPMRTHLLACPVCADEAAALFDLANLDSGLDANPERASPDRSGSSAPPQVPLS